MVIGSTAVYSVFRFVGVMLCVVLVIRTKIRRFAASTQLKSKADVMAWHSQFAFLQQTTDTASKAMLQTPLAVLLLLTLSLSAALVAFTFLRTDIFRQPVFFQMAIVSGIMTAMCLALLWVAAQVRHDGFY